MPCLSVYAEDHPQQPYKVLGLPEHISAELARVGVHYAHCLPEQALGAAPAEAEVVAAYQASVQPLCVSSAVISNCNWYVSRYTPSVWMSTVIPGLKFICLWLGRR